MNKHCVEISIVAPSPSLQGYFGLHAVRDATREVAEKMNDDKGVF